jgi:hypothetical protein
MEKFMELSLRAIDERVEAQKKELEALAEKSKQGILALNQIIPNSLFNIIEKGIIVNQSRIFCNRNDYVHIQASNEGYDILDVNLPRGLWRMVALFEPLDKEIPIKISDLEAYGYSEETIKKLGYKIMESKVDNER